MKAIYVKLTHGGHGKKDRWECPNCRAERAPECRFNLSTEKRGKKHKCRFCGIELELIK